MADEKKNYMNREDKIRGAQKVIKALESLDTKDGNPEQEYCDILEIVLKLLLPYDLVGLTRYRNHGF